METTLEHLNEWLDSQLSPDALDGMFTAVRFRDMPLETAQKLAAHLALKEHARLQANVQRWSEASPEQKEHEVMIRLEDPRRVPLKRYESPLRYLTVD